MGNRVATARCVRATAASCPCPLTAPRSSVRPLLCLRPPRPPSQPASQRPPNRLVREAHRVPGSCRTHSASQGTSGRWAHRSSQSQCVRRSQTRSAACTCCTLSCGTWSVVMAAGADAAALARSERLQNLCTGLARAAHLKREQLALPEVTGKLRVVRWRCRGKQRDWTVWQQQHYSTDTLVDRGRQHRGLCITVSGINQLPSPA